MPAPRASQALSRFTVLDLTRVRAGPTAARQLADWGANVIKVELPEHLDTSEGMGGPRHGSDFQNLHRNKRAITIDLKSDAGRALFERLAAKADVVIENFRPDVKTRLGIDYAALSKINPRLVYASISGFGQDGPYVKRPGFDQIAQGLGGLMSITGEPGRGPMRVGIAIADLSAGLFAAQGIMIALLEREVSGKGQEVATSLLQSQIFMLDFQAARWLNEGEVPQQAGNNHPTSIPTGVFKTKDGYLNIAASGGAMWERLCDVLGDGQAPVTEPRQAQRRPRPTLRDGHHRRMGRAPEQVRRAVRADSLHRQDVRGRAGASPGCRRAHRDRRRPRHVASSRPARAPLAHTEPLGRPAARARRAQRRSLARSGLHRRGDRGIESQWRGVARSSSALKQG
jgi:crotonobetainyl-CoA:carnitine CoA-transferase CaiB-like acyl-CoA transferase